MQPNEPKTPKSKSTKKLEEKKIEARVNLKPETADLKSVFDFAAELAKDKYPKSSSKVGESVEEEIRGKKRLVHDTLQSNHFDKVIKKLVETKYFKSKMEGLLEGVSYAKFLDFVDRAYHPEKFGDKVDDEIKTKVIDALFDFCEKSREEIIPLFDFEEGATDEERQFKGSDLVINLITNLIMKGQVL